MYLVTGKITRPTVNHSFYTIVDPVVSDTVRQHWTEVYKITGKCVSVEATLSTDQLELQTSQYWLDQTTYLEYKNDPLLIEQLFNVRDAYWQANGMTGLIVSEQAV